MNAEEKGQTAMKAKSPTGPVYFKEWRIHAGYSQEELALILNVNAATVSRIETQKRDFVGSYLFRFAKACNCPSPGDPVGRPPSQISIDALFRGNAEDRRRAEEILTAAIRSSLWSSDESSLWKNDGKGGEDGNDKPS
ncbi:XRE family transcriptional regulator [Sinorhizobium meliloti]|nr:helix-turn-helix transcriptional regulator [Sinorhizobium meliloti]PST24868.1 XRE family transcriptional regulator [Mesorhizobium loti]ARS71416.1 transcriptional regulator [Sinorhizobium meliloti RU11/001]MBP2466401.1 transcriptional regulator with XRE-family HTH domain [Sinorhizobium meliloti]MCO6422702.1 helix-turn-helix transcriptional regulator [Sinorhizobium meliloti]MDE3790118.1 helix-turn-helix transcriptional regulator [Sinorhizobium meliloti]